MNVSKAAENFLKNRVEKENGMGMLLSVKDSGCNGLSYVLDVIHAIDPADMTETLPTGLLFSIQRSSVKFLMGTDIDYVAVENNLGLKKLTFKNPNAVGQCGCGESFNVSNSNVHE